MIYALVALAAVSPLTTAYVARLIIAHLVRENGKLQAAVLARRADPVTAAVYQTYEPTDERSPEMLLEDSKQSRRDTKPLGL